MTGKVIVALSGVGVPTIEASWNEEAAAAAFLDAAPYAAGVDTELQTAFNVAAITFLMLKASTRCQLSINGGVTGDDIQLEAGKALLWHDGLGTANPFASVTDVNTLTVLDHNTDNSAVEAGALSLVVLITP